MEDILASTNHQEQFCNTWLYWTYYTFSSRYLKDLALGEEYLLPVILIASIPYSEPAGTLGGWLYPTEGLAFLSAFSWRRQWQVLS